MESKEDMETKPCRMNVMSVEADLQQLVQTA